MIFKKCCTILCKYIRNYNQLAFKTFKTMKTVNMYLIFLLLIIVNCLKMAKLSNINSSVSLYLIPFLYFANGAHLTDIEMNGEREKLSAKSNLEVKGSESGKNTNTELKRKPVRLTMKQGLLMNQVLATYALENVQNELCRNHTKEFKTGVRAFEPWALQMFDSSSKLQAGILLGNLVDYGSFPQCLKIYKNTQFGPIHGKHCLLKIKPSIQLLQKILSFRNISAKRFEKLFTTVEKSELGWSVCVPHTCPRDDILRHFNKTIMDMAEGLDIVVNLDENYCNSVLTQPVMGIKQYLVLLFLGSFIVAGTVAAIIDIRSEGKDSSMFIDSFSAYKNMQRIMKIGSGKKELDFLHGLKFFSSCSVVMGHRFIMYIMFPVVNQLEELDWIIQLSSTAILGSTVSVDSFFMASGMLVSIGFFEYVTTTGSFNLLLFYLHRYLRISLPLALMILFYVSIGQFLGSGTLLYSVYANHQKNCQDYWWAALLHIQTYTNPAKLCIYPIWYLSNEMIFYFLSPVILYPLWKCPSFGYVNIVVLFTLAIISSFYYAWVDKYSGEIFPVTNQLFSTQYFTTFYIIPHIRAATYIIGLGFGYIVFQNKGLKMKINKWLNISLWLVSLTVMSTTVLSSHIFYLEDHEYNQLEASIFLTFSRSAWTLGVVWIMWSCMYGYGGIINEFLSAQVFQVLGRITYAIFLLHTILQLYKEGSAKVPLSFSNINVMFDGFADLLATFIIAFVFTVFYELPLIRVETFIFKPRGKKVKPLQ